MTISIPCRKKSASVLQEQDGLVLHRQHHLTLNANVHTNEVYRSHMSTWTTPAVFL